MAISLEDQLASTGTVKPLAGYLLQSPPFSMPTQSAPNHPSPYLLIGRALTILGLTVFGLHADSGLGLARQCMYTCILAVQRLQTLSSDRYRPAYPEIGKGGPVRGRTARMAMPVTVVVRMY